MRPLRILLILTPLAACSSVDSTAIERPIATGDVTSDDPVDASSENDIPALEDIVSPDVFIAMDAPFADSSQPDVITRPDVTPQPDVITQPDVRAQPDVVTQPDVRMQPDVVTVRCGDGTCSPPESCSTCATDCGACDACAAATTCIACASLPNCGWCVASARCTRGMNSGSTDGTCSGSSWAWQTGDCPAVTDPCARNTDCRTCAAQPACGWCGSSSRCLTGTASAPASGSCSRWIFYTMACGG